MRRGYDERVRPFQEVLDDVSNFVVAVAWSVACNALTDRFLCIGTIDTYSSVDFGRR
jgi:hypothetical protein